ncbi:MAG: porin [Planctomycetota bacterium]|nr:porin [Planctomycetota bacterium]
MQRSIQHILAGFALAGISGVSGVASAAPSNEDLAAEVKALKETVQAQQGEIRQLRNDKGETWLNQQRAEEVKALVRDVLADADTRASLAGDTTVTGYKNGFIIASEDGGTVLKINGQVQARYITNFRNNSTGSGGGSGPKLSDDEQGFQIRRARLIFSGNVANPKVEYLLQGTANRDTGGFDIEKAEISYALLDNVKIGGGRYKENFLREEYVGDAKQTAVERSVVDQLFTANYVEGIYGVVDATDWLRLTTSLTDGLRSGDPGGSNTGFLNGGNDFHNDSTGLAVTLRGDVKLAGDWKQGEDFAAWSKDKTGVFLGGAVHYELAKAGDLQTAGTTTVTGPYEDFFTYTGDALVKTGGLSLFGAFVGQNIRATDTVARGDLNNYGVVAQAGYFVIPDKLEPFFRYEWIRVDPRVSGAEQVNILTAGANYYFSPRHVKLSVDVVYALQPLTGVNTLGASGPSGSGQSTGLTGLGLLGDNSGRDEQVALRAQVQLTF